MKNENNTEKKKKEGIPVFCERIKMLALESGKCKTHQEFADRVNAAYGKTHLDRSYINKMIAGENDNPNAVTLASIAKAFDVSVDWLLGLTEETATTGGDIANAAATTGLSSECIKDLQIMKTAPHSIDTFIGAVDSREKEFSSWIYAIEKIIHQAVSTCQDERAAFQGIPGDHELVVNGCLLSNLSKYFEGLNYDYGYMNNFNESETASPGYTPEGLKKMSIIEQMGLWQYKSPMAYIYAMKIFNILGECAKKSEFPIIDMSKEKRRSKDNTSTKQTKEGRKKK